MGVLVDSFGPKRASSAFHPVPDSLTAALSSNDPATLHSLLAHPSLDVNALWVYTDPKTGAVCLRSLLMLAACHSATEALAILLRLGADANLQSPDDQTTALHCACGSGSVAAISQLVNAGARLDLLDKQGRSPRDLLGLEAAQASPADQESELDCYKTDEFRMYSFKVDLCQRLDEQHDWTTCPFMHPGEKARRRDPRAFKYNGVPCPDFRKGSCKRGDACTYAHGVFECWLHPARYRTQLCKEGALCKRSVCFFAHSMEELREPLFLHEDDKPTSLPGSPKGPLTPGEASTLDGSSRASSPGPSSSRDCLGGCSACSSSGATSTLRALPADHALAAATPAAVRRGGGSGASALGAIGAAKQLRASAESLRGVLSLSRAHSCGSSTDLSLTGTPVVDCPLSASASPMDLAHSISSLSLAGDDSVHAAAAAAAAAAVAALGVASPQPQLAAASSPLLGQAGAGSPGWGLCGGLQVNPDMLSYQLAAAGLHLPLRPASSVMPGAAPSLADQAALLQATALQQSLGLGQVQAPQLDQSAAVALLAAVGLRQPLHPLSLNVGHHPFHPPPTSQPSCFGM